MSPLQTPRRNVARRIARVELALRRIVPSPSWRRRVVLDRPHHLRTHSLLLPLPLISQSLPLPQNPKSTRSCPTVQTSNMTQIRSQPGFLKNAHQFLFPQSPILSTFPSSPASFTPLSRNLLSHHCLRNQHWIKKNCRTIGQSRICLSFPK